ncbi:hypothetical protein GGR56DRAFT_242058 [Xylariaceae sp. FL0804]|nr:hypothetical protein GGR56DRAFT_242058 [Xylariaceae sp. FL0804]
MAKRDDLSGWYEDQERTYYADSNGRPIVVKQNPFNYHSPATGIPIYPQVVRGDFKPSTDTASSSSYPPRSRRPSPSSRFSDHNTPYFGPGSVHSGRGHVDHPASTPSVSGYSRPNISTDVYRDAKGEFYRAGPSKSPYDQRYHQYKANQDEALQLSKEYATWKEPNRLGVPPHERDAHPEMYGGRPLATKEWHDEGGRRAREVAKASHA